MQIDTIKKKSCSIKDLNSITVYTVKIKVQVFKKRNSF
jgi:hypothetical protein